jgi:hypothetical protein
MKLCDQRDKLLMVFARRAFLFPKSDGIQDHILASHDSGSCLTLSTDMLSDPRRTKVSRLSRHCGILNISQPYSSPRLVTGIALLFYMQMMFVPLVRTEVSEESIASSIRVTRIGELGIKLAVTINRSKLRRNIT